MQKYSTVYIKNNMKGLVGALCWWGAWGPGPLGPPLNPALIVSKHHSTITRAISHSLFQPILPSHCPSNEQCLQT